MPITYNSVEHLSFAVCCGDADADVLGFKITDDVRAAGEQDAGDAAGDDQQYHDNDDGLEGDASVVGGCGRPTSA